MNDEGEDELDEMACIYKDIHTMKKHLPKKRITGRLMPILALPDKCKSTFILPKEYWTPSFTSTFW